MQKKCKILISAYSCNPTKGSEPGVGWNWVLEVHKLGYSIFVLTRKKNKIDIEKCIAGKTELKTITFIYHDLSPILLKLKKWIGVYAYYELWQLTALKVIKKNHKDREFNLVHHLTFGSFRQPSYLFKLNIPFYFGPVGGGEYTPPKLLKRFPFKYRFKENIRKIANKISLKRRTLNQCFNAAKIIFCKTDETRCIIPFEYKRKTILQYEIGQNVNTEIPDIRLHPGENKPINVLFAGRLIYWKGGHLAILSFYKFSLTYPNSSLTLIGEGKFKKYLIDLVEKLGISTKVEFIGNVDHSFVTYYYKKADIFLFPTLHDSSGIVILEALNAGLPTVCLNTGGPSFLLSSECPSIIECKESSQEEVIERIAKMLKKLSDNPHFYHDCSKWSWNRIKELTWTKAVQNTYNLIEQTL